MESGQKKKTCIAVLGACCSRDIFNKNFCKNWRNYFDVVFYQFQPSFISLAACPIPYSRSLMPEDGAPVFLEMLQDECTKDTYNNLLSVQPEVLFIDFYSDVINGVLPINDYSYIVDRSSEWKENAIFLSMKKGAKIIPTKQHDQYLAMWKKGFDFFMNFMHEFLPDTKIIINSARCNNIVRNEDGSTYVHKFGWDIELLNSVWEEMDYYAVNKYELTQIKNQENYLLNSNYHFGFIWIVHYCPEYYHDRLEQLKAATADVIPHETTYSKNLLINGDCSLGTLFWKNWSPQFEVEQEEQGTVISYVKKDYSKKKWAQCWSADIECDISSRREYTISFDCFVSDQSLLDEKKEVFAIRTFEKRNRIIKKDSTQNMQVSLRESHADNTWKHYEVKITPEAKYLSVGLFVAQNGNLKWRNIQIYHSQDEGTYPYTNSVSEQILIKSDDTLLDVNMNQITNLKQLGQ